MVKLVVRENHHLLASVRHADAGLPDDRHGLAGRVKQAFATGLRCRNDFDGWLVWGNRPPERPGWLSYSSSAWSWLLM